MITEEDIQKQIEEDQKIIDKIHDDLKAAKRYNRIATCLSIASLCIFILNQVLKLLGLK